MKAEILRLRHLLSMPRAEIISRANAWDEVKAAGSELIQALQDGGSVTSKEVATLASAILQEEPDNLEASPQEYNALLDKAKTLAGSCLEQYPGNEEAPDAAARSLADAQRHGQADPLIKTVAIGKGSTGPNGTDKEA